MLHSYQLVSAFLQASITPCRTDWKSPRWTSARSLKPKVSEPRGCKNALWEQAEMGRQEREREDRDVPRAERGAAGRMTKKASRGPSLCIHCNSAYVYIPKQCQSLRTGDMWTRGRKREIGRKWTNAQKLRALSDNPGTIIFQSWEQDFEITIAKENSHYLFYCTLPL